MFTKLFSSITTSSIWNEDNNTRIVWITMLALSNKNGYVAASIGGLAHEARVSREECEKALKVLSSPDIDSRSKEMEGRRVEIVDGGFQLINHAKYRSMRSEEERKEYMKAYMVEYRRTKNVNNSVNNVSECKPPLAKAEADTEAEEINTPPFGGIKLESKDSFKPPSRLLHAWCRAYREIFNVDYMVTEGKDESAAKRLMSPKGSTVEYVIEVARKAWAHDGFNSKQALSLSGFASRFNEIRGEVLSIKTSHKRRLSIDEIEARESIGGGI